MTTRYLVVVTMAAWFAATAGAQPGADLLQKGLYAQETQGDLDGAIQIYRQVIAAPGTAKPVAAQAQYQIVLSMLQKGDRPAASRELDLLTRNFPDQQDFINKARKLVPGSATLLTAPWAAGEASQLNIKRDGVFTGEYLYYTATPWQATVREQDRNPNSNYGRDYGQMIMLGWKLVTKSSTRSIEVHVDRETFREQRPASVNSDDILGDVSALPFAGPAIDAEPLVFRMRVLPLAVGYKTTLSSHPFAMGGVTHAVDLTVTGVEIVQTVAGKFNCYKISFPSLGQTFWIGVDGARPLVKFQSGKVEAELVKMWGPTVIDDAASFLKAAGWGDVRVTTEWSGEDGKISASQPTSGPVKDLFVDIRVRRIFTPPAEVERRVQESCAREAKDTAVILAQSVQNRTFGGYPSQSCLIDYKGGSRQLLIWVRSENLELIFRAGQNVPVFRWIFEPVLDTIKLP